MSQTFKSTASKRSYSKKDDEQELIVIPDPIVEYSAHQKRIFSHMMEVATRDRKCAAISASAGSGKSFTIRALIKMLMEAMVRKELPRGSIGSFQFNTHIKEEMIAKIGSHPNLNIMTVSGSGLQALKHNRIFPKAGIKYNKYYLLCSNAIQENLSYVCSEIDDTEKAKGDQLKKKMTSQLTEIVNMTMNTLTPLGDIDAGLEMVDKYSLECSSTRLFRLAQDVIETAVDMLDQGQVAFQDMLYGPVHKNLDFPKYDWIFCDECQDFSALQLEIISRYRHENTIMFGFGDPNQSIMAFAGALSDSFNQFVTKFDCRVLPLSVCYRCPSKVLDLARILVPSIRNRPDCPEGIVEVIALKETMATMAQAGDYFICRMTAPLVQMCIMLIKLRKSAVVKGREIGDKLIELYNKIVEYGDSGELLGKKPFDCADFIGTIRQYSDSEMIRMVKKKSSQFKIDSFTDQVDCLKIIAEYLSNESLLANTKDHHSSILAEINKLFPKDKDIGRHSIILCTVHKAKGLEADNIFIIEFHKMPHSGPKGKVQSTEQKQQELNILYVAMTRPKKALYFQGEGFTTVEEVVTKLRSVTLVKQEVKASALDY